MFAAGADSGGNLVLEASDSADFAVKSDFAAESKARFDWTICQSRHDSDEKSESGGWAVFGFGDPHQVNCNGLRFQSLLRFSDLD